MDSDLGDENTTSYKEHQRSVHERARGSMHHLQRTFESTPFMASGNRRRPRSLGSPGCKSPQTRSPRVQSPDRNLIWEESYTTEHADYSYGAAVNRLRNMLRKHEEQTPKTVQFSARTYGSVQDALSYAPAAFIPSAHSPYLGLGLPLPRGQIPTPEECVPLLQQQSVLIQQLEAENKYCKDELHALKLKVHEVVEENRILHEELKHSVIQEILQEGIDVPGIPATIPTLSTNTVMEVEGQPSARQMGREDWAKWQKELERINALHLAKANRLEAQLHYTREELKMYEQETEELRKQIRMRDSLSKADPELIGLAAGLCIKCATNEAIIQPTGSAGQSIITLTRERDELMKQLAVLKTRYEELRKREDDMYEQMKQSIHMVEQAHLEETQLIIERDQLKEELAAMQKRVAQHAEEVMEKLAEERELIRKEFKAELEELKAKVKELTHSLVETQNELDKTTREKLSLMADIEAVRGQVDMCDIDYGKATDTMKMSMTQATLERNAAVSEMAKLKKEFERIEKEREQERSRLRQEMYQLRQRLSEAEKELVEAKEECVHLTNTMQQLEREAHMAKLAKESIEKNRSDDVKNIMKRAELREAELNNLLDQLEAKYTSTISELENIIASQSNLIMKLRAECRKLAHQLEDVTCRYRGDNKKLKSQNDQIKTRLERCLKRSRDLEEQHIQQGALQDKMRQRLKQMDEHAGKCTQQVLDLLAKQSALMRDRQLLAKEVEFLRRHLLNREEAEMNQFYSAQKSLVDDILRDVKGEEQAKIRELIPHHDMEENDSNMGSNASQD